MIMYETVNCMTEDELIENIVDYLYYKNNEKDSRDEIYEFLKKDSSFDQAAIEYTGLHFGEAGLGELLLRLRNKKKYKSIEDVLKSFNAMDLDIC